ncbi:MAG: RNA polymerase sigma factor [Deltaproteobacteria bacterium]|nr:RNA polymerase sigma factor [Deltaproteobacteria bacterium]
MGLIKAFGSTDAEVVREHGPRVYALLRRLFGPSDVVDDVFQNVFIEVLRSRPLFAGRSSPRTWIHRIALNVAYQEMRQQYRRHDSRLPPDVLLPENHDAHHEAALRQRERWLYAALAHLPPKQRTAVVLHDLDGRSLRTIADDLGLPLQTVASQVRLGRARLSDLLAGLRDPASARVADQQPDEEEA